MHITHKGEEHVPHYCQCPWTFYDPACTAFRLVDGWALREMVGHWTNWKALQYVWCAVYHQYCCFSQELHVVTAIWQRQPWEEILFPFSDRRGVVSANHWQCLCVCMVVFAKNFTIFKVVLWAQWNWKSVKKKSWKRLYFFCLIQARFLCSNLFLYSSKTRRIVMLSTNPSFAGILCLCVLEKWNCSEVLK